MQKTASPPANVPKPQFKDLTFPSQKDFNAWLVENTHITVGFEDRAGDLLKMYIHKSGEILHCNAHERIYNGSFVKMDELFNGHPIWILNTNFRQTMYQAMENLIVEDIKFSKAK